MVVILGLKSSVGGGGGGLTGPGCSDRRERTLEGRFSNAEGERSEVSGCPMSDAAVLRFDLGELLRLSRKKLGRGGASCDALSSKSSSPIVLWGGNKLLPSGTADVGLSWDTEDPTSDVLRKDALEETRSNGNPVRRFVGVPEYSEAVSAIDGLEESMDCTGAREFDSPSAFFGEAATLLGSLKRSETEMSSSGSKSAGRLSSKTEDEPSRPFLLLRWLLGVVGRLKSCVAPTSEGRRSL